MAFRLFLIFSSLFLLAHGCLLNKTHCTCAGSPAGGSCLRYSTTSGTTHLCDSYQCGPGTVCDCMGTSLCARNACPALRSIFRPLPDTKVEPGKLTPCSLATDATCLTVIAAIPKPGPTPSTSSPSPSGSVTATPSSSATPDSPVTTTPKPSSSRSPTPVLPLPRGSFCSEESAPCEDGTKCSCNGKCEKEVDLDLSVLGDQSARIFACGEEIGFSRGWEHLGQFSYTGPCSDMIVEVSNADGYFSALAMTVEYGGNAYSTGLGSGLSAVVKGNPPPGYLTYPDYDFRLWKTPVIHQALAQQSYGAYIKLNEHYGALPIALRDGPSPPGTFVYKIFLPFCKDSDDWDWQL